MRKLYFRYIVWKVGRELKARGLARRSGFGKYEITDLGRLAVEDWQRNTVHPSDFR